MDDDVICMVDHNGECVESRRRKSRQIMGFRRKSASGSARDGSNRESHLRNSLDTKRSRADESQIRKSDYSITTSEKNVDDFERIRGCACGRRSRVARVVYKQRGRWALAACVGLKRGKNFTSKWLLAGWWGRCGCSEHFREISYEAWGFYYYKR